MSHPHSHSIYLSELPVRKPQTMGNPLLRKIQRACRMSLAEPDLALNLDIADYINEKQGAAPRDAAIALAKLINNRESHVAIFALSLLDVLVKNCGYPFHLQISRKEFLNELVKRFPGHPPLRYSKIQRLILTAIEEWYQTICKHSSYKNDMGYIRDMHRLLKYKGYAFPKISESDLAVLKPSNQLKTASEIQKEQEIAQAAKLEELIRRGKPEDLREANKLMKIMAGFKEDNAVQAKQAISSELNKLKRKADLLNEMLESPDSQNWDNETTQELHSALKVAQPKFQKIIEEEQEDDELVQDLLKFNDTVNLLLEKFSLLKNGNSNAASQIHPSHVSAPLQQSSGALTNEINLIDFNDLDETPSQGNNNTNGTGTPAAAETSVNDLLGDLTDLSISNTQSANQTSFGLGGDIVLGSSQPAPPITTTNNSNNTLDLLGLSSPQPPTNAQAPNSNGIDLLSGFNTTTSTATAPARTLVNQSSKLKIEFEISRESSSVIRINSFFTNLSSSPISNLVFLLAVPKSMALRLQPQSSNFMVGDAKDGITQEGTIENAPAGSSKALKVKWKVNYSVNSTQTEETAVFTLPNV
ncbi:phosphatidylinositol 4-phosphate-binding protein [Saccharomyces paradoxus]|uniref:Phosphatidylinositol 4-phosphate-binding protein n=1 Tax=Saccharomyces paradoxus TaxID=27291 RepID=A0A8B8USR6_SACPA|nr:Gga2 [Saccharomyces paradoxus]QHS73746.1 Gga2 [Saccharomyces paradoxus]